MREGPKPPSAPRRDRRSQALATATQPRDQPINAQLTAHAPSAPVSTDGSMPTR